MAPGQDPGAYQASPAPPSSPLPTAAQLAVELEAAVARAVGDLPKVSLLFSGGLDSSLLAHLLRSRCASDALELELVTIGTRGAQDLEAAREAAALLPGTWRPHVVSPEAVRHAGEQVRARARRAGAAPGPGHVAWEVQTGIFLALREAQDPVVLCGQGADELFLGYAHFRPLSGPRLKARYDEDLARLLQEDLPFSLALAESRGSELRAPYLDSEWRKLLEPVPLELRRPGGLPKGLLREIARGLGLPSSLCERPKKALQYGSGVHAALSAR